MDNLTVELVKTAQNREYTKFEEVAKELLKAKMEQSDKYLEFQEKMQEACDGTGPKGPKGKGRKDIDEDEDDDDEDNDPDSKDAKQNSDDEDGDGKKDKDEKHGDLRKDFTGKDEDADKED